MARVAWTLRARDDLVEIEEYIALDSPNRARQWTEALRERARRAARYPKSGRRVPEWDREDLREVIFGNYRIIYRIDSRGITVLTVIEGHRLLSSRDR